MPTSKWWKSSVVTGLGRVKHAEFLCAAKRPFGPFDWHRLCGSQRGKLARSMAWFWNLNLIHVFNFYLGLTFLVSTYVRWTQYRSGLSLVRAVPGRWPRLFQLVKQHRNVFLTWSTILPALLAFTLFAVNIS